MPRSVGLTLLIVTLAVGIGWQARSAVGAAAEQEVKINAGEFWFKPKEVTVKPGSVTFTIKNVGGVAHTFVIEKVKGALVKGALVKEFDPGKTAALKVTLSAGKYAAFCDVPGHREAGMQMQIVVK